MIDEIRWKFVASVAIIAMAVSLVSGGLSGITFGVLIIRALAGGIAFSVLAIGVNLLIARMFPEILESGDSDISDIPDENDEVGGRVNIISPADDVQEVEDTGQEPREEVSGSEQAVEGTVIGREDIDEPEELQPAADAENLEDLDRFSGTFTEVDDETSGPSARTHEGPGADNDPQEIAQAIQTVMKRDKKG